MPENLDGTAFSDATLPRLRALADRAARRGGRRPTLALVTASDDPAQESYIGLKRAAAERAGVEARWVALDGTAGPGAVRDVLTALGADAGVDGIFCQVPLDGVDAADEPGVLAAIPPAKDVDGASPTMRTAWEEGAGVVDLPGGGRCLAWRPASPLAALELLRHHEVPVEGRTALIVGDHVDADALGRLLEMAGSRVTRVHERSAGGAPELPEPGSAGGPPYDIVVAAGPMPDEPPPGLLAEEAAVVDLGYAPVSPLLPDAWVDRARWHCPAKGGVGPATIAVILRQTIQAALGDEAVAEAGVAELPSAGGPA